jgi:Rrf2 family transcriptional regulator, cysteine metabolism repressor
VRTTTPSSGALHFSTRGEYGVRLMVELARHHGSGPVSLAEMAEHEDLPRPYLEQLVVSLREAGLVTSTRGAHGGYELSRHPSRIHMAEVVTALEGPIAPMICASGDLHPVDLCSRGGYCSVDLLWRRVRDAVVAALESTSLAELTPPGPGHPAHPTSPDRADQPALFDAVLVTVRPLSDRPAKESIVQP